MAVTVTNIKASQSLHAQSVIITLNATDSAQLTNINVGDKATLDSNGKIGYVCRVDKFGHSFKVNPETPIKNFASDSVPGYLAPSESITIE